MNKNANQLSESPEGKEMNNFIKNLNSILKDVIAVEIIIKLDIEEYGFVRCPSGNFTQLILFSLFHS